MSDYEENISKNIIKRIEDIRKLYKLSKKEFAKELGYKSSTWVTQILNEKVPLSNDFVLAICYRYDISKEWLETGNGNIYKDNTSNEKDYTISLLNRMNYKSKKFIIRVLKVLIKFQNMKGEVKNNSNINKI